MSHELYKVYRPKVLREVVGQHAAVRQLQSMFNNHTIPHALMFMGPSGCGKTTLARIVADALNCSSEDFVELNSANNRGIDSVRLMAQQARVRPIAGGARVWLIDEAQGMTNDAQGALLKLLEDAPETAYFIICTTHPQKIIATVKNRCTKIELGLLNPKEIAQLLMEVCAAEKVKVDKEVIEKIIEHAQGSARQALVLLDQVIGLDAVDDQIDAICKTESQTAAFEIAKALLGGSWAAVCPLVKNCEEDPEGIRRLILSYMTTVLLGGGKASGRAFDLISIFRDNWFDCGKAGLAACCLEACKSR